MGYPPGVGPLGWLLVQVLLGAAFLLAYVVTLWQALRSGTTGRGRWLALAPPLAPLVAWRSGRRLSPIAVLALAVAYGLARVLA